MSATSRSTTVFSLDEAVGAAPVLSQLRERLALSERCLGHVRSIRAQALATNKPAHRVV